MIRSRTDRLGRARLLHRQPSAHMGREPKLVLVVDRGRQIDRESDHAKRRMSSGTAVRQLSARTKRSGYAPQYVSIRSPQSCARCRPSVLYFGIAVSATYVLGMLLGIAFHWVRF